ncbi:MAG: DUF5050 domain-containing protein, partial [Clostridia bacterium]|nr:DUF5050 domain-containing protein [Clostridia bacterium]
MKRLLILCLTLLLLTGCRTTEPQETTPEAAIAADTLPELDKLPEETETSAEAEETEETEALPVPDAGNTPAADENTTTGEQPTAVPEQKPAETNPEPAETEEPEETEKTPAPADPPAEPEKPEDPAVLPPETEETRKDTEPLPEPAPEPAVSTPDTPAIPEIRTGMRDIDLPDVSNPEKLGFDGGNISMGGRMCGDGNGWVYFCQQYTGNSGRGLYKAKLDGTDAVKLTDDYPAKSINVLDGWVYYCGTSNEYLIRVRTDGTDRQVLLNRVCDDLHAAESGLYFTALDDSRNPSVYYMSHDGKTMALLLEDTEMAAYWNGQVYGVSYDLLSRYAIHTGIIEDFPINVVSGYTMADDTGFYYQGSEVGSHTQCFYRYTPGGDAEVLDMNHLYYN